MNDYIPEIILVALVAHRRFEGGGVSRVSDYANSLFNRFDARIRATGTQAGHTFDATQRSVIAATAAMVGGVDNDAADEAVATFISLFLR